MNRSILWILMAAGVAQLLVSINWLWQALSSAPGETDAAIRWTLAVGMLLVGSGMLLIGILGLRQIKSKADRNG